MQKSQGDGLLVAARILVVLITVILVVSLVAVCLGIGELLSVGQDELWKRIAAADAPASAYWVVIAAFAIIAVAIGFAAKFFETLHQIVLSVDRGDPFEQANARRLRRMGWLAVIGQLLMLPLGAMGSWLSPYLERLGENYHVDLGLDPAALLLILVLFILARVFERGAAMQTDLEGTV
jgi:hypothetical protein